MKKLIIIIILILAAYFVYKRFLAPSREQIVETAQDKLFDEKYSAVVAAKQTEAKEWARIIQNKQEEYFAVNGKYCSDLGKLGFVPRIGQYYVASIRAADDVGYVIEISGNIDADPTIDVWEVTRNAIKNIVNDVNR